MYSTICQDPNFRPFLLLHHPDPSEQLFGVEFPLFAAVCQLMLDRLSELRDCECMVDNCPRPVCVCTTHLYLHGDLVIESLINAERDRECSLGVREEQE